MASSKFESLLPRILVAAVFIPFFLLIIHRGGVLFFLTVEVIAFGGLIEFYHMSTHKGGKPIFAIGIAGIFVIGILIYTGLWDWLFVSLMAMIGVTMIWQITRRDDNTHILSVSSTITGTLYIGGFFSFLLLLREMPRYLDLDYSDGGRFIILLFVVTWFCDTGAYGIGSWIGRRKLIPRISPGKSVEGFLGGIAMALVGIFLARSLFASFLTVGDCIWLGLGCGLLGQAGDLVESLYKRDAGIKDSSSLIPGHGGILDIFDSVLFNAPFFYLYLKYVKY